MATILLYFHQAVFPTFCISFFSLHIAWRPIFSQHAQTELQKSSKKMRESARMTHLKNTPISSSFLLEWLDVSLKETPKWMAGTYKILGTSKRFSGLKRQKHFRLTEAVHLGKTAHQQVLPKFSYHLFSDGQWCMFWGWTMETKASTVVQYKSVFRFGVSITKQTNKKIIHSPSHAASITSNLDSDTKRMFTVTQNMHLICKVCNKLRGLSTFPPRSRLYRTRLMARFHLLWLWTYKRVTL